MKNYYRFDSSRSVSSAFGLIIIMALSLFTAWYSLNVAREFINDLPDFYGSGIKKELMK